MDELVTLFLLVVFLVFLGVIGGWVAFFRTKDLRQRVSYLEAELQKLTQITKQPVIKPAQQRPLFDTAQNTDQTLANKEVEPASDDTPSEDTRPAYDHWQPSSPQQAKGSTNAGAASDRAQHITSQQASAFFKHLKQNWLTWVGGLCVGLSGIFLVKYSIDQGLLGPEARIALAIFMGLSFHGVAFWLKGRLNFNSDAVAALAGGASITLYAALLAALHLYNLFSPTLVFILLACISIGTMLLALVYGPVLAAIGILGAYIVPILVNTGSNNVAGALIYSAIITLSAFALFRYVFRRWLWVGVILASTAWWLIAYNESVSLSILLSYLIVMGYSVLAIRTGDWALNQHDTLPNSRTIWHALYRQYKRLAPDEIYTNGVLALLTLAWLTVGMQHTLSTPDKIIAMAFFGLLFFICKQRHSVAFLPLLAITGFTIVAALGYWSPDYVRLLPQATIAQLLIGISIISALGAYWNLIQTRFQGYWSALATLTPVVMMSLAYLRLEGFANDWQWATAALILALFYSALAKQLVKVRWSDLMVVSVLLAAHFAYSLAAVILLSDAHLTLALSIQLISLCYLNNRYPIPVLVPCVKLLVIGIVLRLTLNPYLPNYALTPHWPIWVFGGPFICSVLAWRLLPSSSQLQGWLQGASLHLLALTVIAETRYMIYGGDVFHLDFTQREAAINTLIWGSLGLVYWYRSTLSGSLIRLYQIAASALLIGALANYLFGSVLAFNPLFHKSTWLTDTPIFNTLLLMYLLPTILLVLAYFTLPKRLSKVLLGLVAASSFLLINLEIRHLWHGAAMLISDGTEQGELYTYSMVWLGISIAILALAIQVKSALIYRAGMLVLMCVVAKIFLIDMSGLSGLLRVTSFLGLGLCLLGIALLHQKIGFGSNTAQPREAE